MKGRIKRDRGVSKGFDVNKLYKIWIILAQNGDWMHIAEISRRSGIHEATVRWYLDHYMRNAIDEQRIVPTIKLRLVRLKPNMDFKTYVKALDYINEIKKD